MATRRREDVYLRQSRRMTPRQWRQLNRMGALESHRDEGSLPHGGTGVPMRKPLPRAKNGRGGRHHRAAADGPAQTPTTSTVGAGPAAPASPVGGGAGGRVPDQPERSHP
jgi:hypothetical protein